MDRRDVQGLLTAMRAIASERPHSTPEFGTAIGASYDPVASTTGVQIGSTAAIIGDDGDQPIPHPTVRLATMAIGDQYGPRAGNDRVERMLILQTMNGPVGIFVHDYDDAPQAAAGERWIVHYNDAGDVDAFFKHTNDGPTDGDGLGGAHYGGDAGLTQATTKSGHSVRLDDTARTIETKTADGLSSKHDDNDQTITHAAGETKTIVDGAGRAIAQVATYVGIGDHFASLPANAAAITNTHLTTFEDSLWSKRLDDLEKLVAAMIAAGVPNAGLVLAQLATLLHTDVPAGSATARIKA